MKILGLLLIILGLSFAIFTYPHTRRGIGAFAWVLLFFPLGYLLSMLGLVMLAFSQGLILGLISSVLVVVSALVLYWKFYS